MAALTERKAKPRIPRSVVVGCHTYDITREPQMEEDKLGLCKYDDTEIQLCSQLRSDKLKEILLHEILHACGYPTLCGDDEKFVDTIAPVLLQVLRSNAKLVAYLTS